MLISSITSLLFFAVCTIVLVSGILTLQGNIKAPANRVFFALTVAITIWSSGMALAAGAPDTATCEIFRRIAAIGWVLLMSLFTSLFLFVCFCYSK